MPKRYDLLFETAKFNLSQPKEHFINECCYGDDAAAWLAGKLNAQGIEVTEPAQEDWGWYIEAKHNGCAYFIGVGGNAEEESAGNRGEWRLMVDKHRSLKEKLLGRNSMAENEAIIGILKEIIQKEPGLTFLHIE